MTCFPTPMRLAIAWPICPGPITTMTLAISPARFYRVLVVADVFHPLDCLAVESLLNCDVLHGGRVGCPMPVFLAGLEPNDVSRPYFLDGLSLTLYPAAAEGDDERLSERVRVPGRAPPQARTSRRSPPYDRRRLQQTADRSEPSP